VKKDRPTWERRKPPARTIEVTAEGAAFATSEQPATVHPLPVSSDLQPAAGVQQPATDGPLAPGLRRMAGGKVVGRIMIDVPAEDFDRWTRYKQAHRAERPDATTIFGPDVIAKIRTLPEA
jgi:hypothetical protein